MIVTSGKALAEVDLVDDYDWREAFAYADPSPCEGSTCSLAKIEREDVAEVLYAREGENDGPNWILIGRTHDGRWFHLTAGCDYTGWDCQAGGQCWASHDLDNLIQFGIDDDARQEFGL